MPALALWMSTAPVLAEPHMAGFNLNLNFNAGGGMHGHENFDGPPGHMNLPTPPPPPSPPVSTPASPGHVSLPVSVPSVSFPSAPNASNVNVNNPLMPQVFQPSIDTHLPHFAPHLVSPAQFPQSFKMANGESVRVDKGAQVLVFHEGDRTRIQNLTGLGNAVHIHLADAQGRDREIKLAPGTELVTSKLPLTERDVRIPDGVARRNVNVNGNIATAEIDLNSLLQGNGELRRLVLNPANAAERKLGNQILKTAASLLTVRGGEGFEQSPPPSSGNGGGGGSSGGSGSSVAVQTANSLNAPSPQPTPAPQQVNQSTIGTTNPSFTNTFDQTRPIISNSFSRMRARNRNNEPRRIAQVPPPLLPGPVAVPVPVHVPPGATSTGATPSTKKGATPNAGGRASTRGNHRGGAAAENSAAAQVNAVLGTIHSQLKKTVQQHPTLAIFLIALFGIMCAVMAALAVGIYKSRHEVDRLNRGLQAKLAETNELNDELTRTRDKAIEGSRLKSEFVANISHEIRTPITAVLGMIGLLRETEHDTRENEVIKMLDESARSLLTVINDILDFSKIEAGMLVIQTVDFHVADMARDVVELLAGSAKEKNIDLALTIDASADKVVRGDPFRLRQVLVNLLGNAIKFTSEGSVSLLVQAEEKNMIGFHVKDTGIGISEDARKLLFQPFSQADGTTTRRYGGTGLGLSISRRLVELMGGRIDFESESGKGSHFWFTIPFEQPASEPTRAPEMQSSAPAVIAAISRPRILVAEDSVVLQRIVVHQLKKLNYDVLLVPNGREAVEALKRERFDLVLMDWQMPELDGIQATKQIRELTESGTVPIIAMTANAMEGDRLSCLNAGMNDYISKPFTIEQLQKAIETWLPVREQQDASS